MDHGMHVEVIGQSATYQRWFFPSTKCALIQFRSSQIIRMADKGPDPLRHFKSPKSKF